MFNTIFSRRLGAVLLLLVCLGVTAHAQEVNNIRTILEGEKGRWDKHAVRPVAVIDHPDDELWLYYEGRQKPGKPFKSAIGVAYSSDGGHTWKRKRKEPVLDPEEFSCLSLRGVDIVPPSRADDDKYHAYIPYKRQAKEGEDHYAPGHPQVYNIAYATSSDGLNWKPEGDLYSVDGDHPFHASVHKSNGTWYLFYGDTSDPDIQRISSSTMDEKGWGDRTTVLQPPNWDKIHNVVREPNLGPAGNRWELWIAGVKEGVGWFTARATADELTSTSWQYDERPAVTGYHYPVIARKENYEHLTTDEDQMFLQDRSASPLTVVQGDLVNDEGSGKGEENGSGGK